MKYIRELWALDEKIQQIADEIHALEEKRETFAKILRSERRQLDLRADLPLAQRYLYEEELAHPVESTKLSGLRVCGIDGGLLKKTLRGIELVITRAIATIFEYTPAGQVAVEYFPQHTIPPSLKAELTPISYHEAEVNASLERTKAELELAIRVQDHHSSELLLLDGSLSPHISDRPPKQSLLSAKYQEISRLYQKLYEKTEETGTLLAGIVKDSRSNRFVRILGELMPHIIRRYPSLQSLLDLDYRSILKLSYDTDFFFRILEVGERSPIFRLINSNKQKNLDPEKEQKLVSFYLQTAKYDYPLRVEVFTGNYDPIRIVKKVSAMLVPISSDNEEFALPSVLIDADSQARLIERDLEFLFKQLANRIGYPQSLLKLRRERMPFH